MGPPHLMQLAGWVGGPDSDVEGAKSRLTAAGGFPLRPTGECPDEARPLTGACWTCTGPSMSQSDGVAVAMRGQPVWHTDDRRVLGAPDGARAVLEAYRIHGAAFLELLHGSFALVVVDTAARTVLLAVDRMGVERLAYCARSSELTFAGSAELVARSCGAPPRIRPQSLLDYLFFHMIPSPGTIFEGVHKVPPATCVIFRDGTVSQRLYWQPRFRELSGQAESFDTLRESLHAALTAAVTAAAPDGRTGAFLSGGLDSSTVAGYLGKVTARPARTFSIGFGFDRYDELRYARIANAHFGCDAREYTARPEDVVDQFAAIAAQYDEPFGNASALPTLCCARLAKNAGVDHLLAGDGGDELFAGNKRYAEQLVFERYQRLPAPVRRALLEPVLRATPAPLRVWIIRKACNYVAQANTPLPDRLESWNFLNRLGFAAVLHPEFAATVDTAGPTAHMRSVYAAPPGTALVDRMLHYDWRVTLADNDLRKVGAMCELAGLRVSYPMLHPDVIDVSLRVAPELKMRGTELRTFYKRAMAGFLPREILAKSKHGFGLPFGLWLQRSPSLAELINANLAGLAGRGIVRSEFLDRLVRLHAQDDASYYGVMIWTLAMLEQWFRAHRVAPA